MHALGPLPIHAAARAFFESHQHWEAILLGNASSLKPIVHDIVELKQELKTFIEKNNLHEKYALPIWHTLIALSPERYRETIKANIIAHWGKIAEPKIPPQDILQPLPFRKSKPTLRTFISALGSQRHPDKPHHALLLVQALPDGGSLANALGMLIHQQTSYAPEHLYPQLLDAMGQVHARARQQVKQGGAYQLRPMAFPQQEVYQYWPYSFKPFSPQTIKMAIEDTKYSSAQIAIRYSSNNGPANCIYLAIDRTCQNRPTYIAKFGTHYPDRSLSMMMLPSNSEGHSLADFMSCNFYSESKITQSSLKPIELWVLENQEGCLHLTTRGKRVLSLHYQDRQNNANTIVYRPKRNPYYAPSQSEEATDILAFPELPEAMGKLLGRMLFGKQHKTYSAKLTAMQSYLKAPLAEAVLARYATGWKETPVTMAARPNMFPYSVSLLKSAYQKPRDLNLLMPDYVATELTTILGTLKTLSQGTRTDIEAFVAQLQSQNKAIPAAYLQTALTHLFQHDKTLTLTEQQNVIKQLQIRLDPQVMIDQLLNHPNIGTSHKQFLRLIQPRLSFKFNPFARRAMVSPKLPENRVAYG